MPSRPPSGPAPGPEPSQGWITAGDLGDQVLRMWDTGGTAVLVEHDWRGIDAITVRDELR